MLIISKVGSVVFMPAFVRKNCNSDGILSEEDLKDIAEAKEDIQAGRIYTPKQVRKVLGLE